ncbi:helix-turn-helix transcriptional regulator [Streptomyces sp. NPDC051132]|uniref:helix-turn-helix transcriptional regulator n=1 Tax=unclassified Streptomyces TaxID=2593676 RepID=UPI0034496EA5
MATKFIPRDPEAWLRLGRTIREHREAAGLSRRALAEIAGVSEKSIQVTEEGRVPRGRMPQSLPAIERALGWMPGSHLNILNNEAWLRIAPAEDEDVASERSAPKGAAKVGAVRNGGAQHVLFSSRDRDPELTESGHLAQDVFLRQSKRYRKLQGISLEQLAEKVTGLGVNLSAEDLHGLESGTRFLGALEAKAIASALGVTVEWLLVSGFSDDAPDEMKFPPTAEELEAEAKAIQRRMGDVGAQILSAQHALAVAREREEAARRESNLAMSMLQSAMAAEREMERHYQYLLGRMDSLRAAAGEQTAIEFHPVYEEDETP